MALNSPFQTAVTETLCFMLIDDKNAVLSVWLKPETGTTNHHFAVFPDLSKENMTKQLGLLFFYHQQPFEWYTWKTMCTCRNISFLNISIHYLHINNFQIRDKTCYIMLTKWKELIGNQTKRQHANYIQINTMFASFPFFVYPK